MFLGAEVTNVIIKKSKISWRQAQTLALGWHI